MLHTLGAGHNNEAMEQLTPVLNNANTLNTFKNGLDKFWSDQELVYDYKADITGIGNRSLISLDDTSA